MGGQGKRRHAFLARRFTDAVEARLATIFSIDRPAGPEGPLSAPDLALGAKGCSHVFVSVTEVISADVIEALSPELKVIASLSVGHDHIDLAAARAHGVAVLVTPDVLSEPCAEIAMLLLLAAARRGYEADCLVRSGNWQGWAPTELLGKGLSGQRLGIFGMGRIGREVARRARGFGLEIHYHNRRRLDPELEQDAIYHATLESLLAVSDFLCLTAPGSDALAGMINARTIALMPEGAVIVNIARGDMIDDDALIDALRSGRLAGAGLDVFGGEPRVDPRFAELPNVFLTPHIGSATTRTRDAMGMLLIEGIEALDRGDFPHNRIA